MAYHLPRTYQERSEPEYFDDLVTDRSALIFQPDVYGRAKDLAARLGSTVLVDVGAGSGDKLAAIAQAGQHLVAIDFGDNLVRGPARHPGMSWRDYNAETDSQLPLTGEDASGAVVICSDVIEHIVKPENLLSALNLAMSAGAAAVVLSTPDRVRMWGASHDGPPPNSHHVREWTRDELVSFVIDCGFASGYAGWTREHHLTADLRTIEIVLVAPSPPHEALLADLWDPTVASPPGDFRPLRPMRPGLERFTFRFRRAFLRRVLGRR